MKTTATTLVRYFVFLLIAGTQRTFVQSHICCRVGYTLVGGFCYMINAGKTGDFETQRQRCEDEGAQLIEQPDFRSFLDFNKFLKTIDPIPIFWIGLKGSSSDLSDAESFEWLSSTKPNVEFISGMQPFGKDNPKNKTGHKCMLSGNDGFWYNNLCSFEHVYLACQYDPLTQDTLVQSNRCCRDGYTSVGRFCYMIDADKYGDFEIQRQRCEDEGAQLIDQPDLRSFLDFNKFLKTIYKKEWQPPFWIGLKASSGDLSDAESFESLSSRKPNVEFISRMQPFGKDNPKNVAGLNCMVSSSDAFWYNAPCISNSSYKHSKFTYKVLACQYDPYNQPNETDSKKSHR